MPEASSPRKGDSVIQQLRDAFGAQIDPEVALASAQARMAAAPNHDVEANSNTGSSGVLDRLKTRGGSAQRYRMDGEIGRGAMGAVLEVWDGDLRRHLAMKVALGAGSDGSSASSETLDPRLLARFLEEAQVTGQLEHPGIVPVHELGIDEDGRVYFTMRLVRGQDLEAIFGLVDHEADGWSVTRALGVLLKMCETMAYAHEQGVIHRDLKPANVMIGKFGEVYVMDWGLVRVQGSEDRHDVRIQADGSIATPALAVEPRTDGSGPGGDALYTMDGDIIGTPAYMSPEQARGDLETLNASTDVYALGAMLYRLLSGVTPYSEPGKESGAVAILQGLQQGAPRRIESLQANAPAELVAISEKAMARDPKDRYAGMMALADDLRAYLEHRVVRAYRTGAITEARKWVRRNRPLAASLAAGLLALVGGLITSLVLGHRATVNAELAETRRGEAETAATLAETRRVAAVASEAAAERQSRITSAVNSFLNDDVFAAIAPEYQGKDVSMREVLETAAAKLDGAFPDEPMVEAELRMTIGTSFQKLGEFERSREVLEPGLELRRRELGPNDPRTVEAMRGVAHAWAELGRTEASLKVYENVVLILEAKFDPAEEGTLGSRCDCALLLARQGEFERARAIYVDVLDIYRREHGTGHPNVRNVLNNYGILLKDLGELEAALAIAREAVDLRVAHDGPRHPETLTARNNLAQVLEQMGRIEDSDAIIQETLRLRSEVLGREHPDTARSMGTLGVTKLRAGRYQEAEALFVEALDVLTRTLGEDHHATLLAPNNLCSAWTHQQLNEKALPLRIKTLAKQREVLGDDHMDTLLSMGNLAVLYRNLQRYEEAEKLQRDVVARYERVLGPDHPSTLIATENLGGLLFRLQDYDGSLQFTQKVLEGRKRTLGPDHSDVARTTFNMAMIANRTGDKEQTKSLLESALERSRKALGAEHPQVAACLIQLAHLHNAARDSATAAPMYEEALRIHEGLGTTGETNSGLRHQLAYCAYVEQDYQKAIELLERALAERRALPGDHTESTLQSLRLLAKALIKAERFAEAEPLAKEYHEKTLATQGADHADVASARKLLAELYIAWEKPEAAKDWQE